MLGKLRWLPLALVVVVLPGCHTMRAVGPSQVGTARELPEVWVTGVDHRTVVLNAPEVRGDTLAGFIDGAYHEMPLSDVVAIRARQASRLRTAALVATGAVATSALLVYFGNRSYVSGGAQTCTSGLTTDDVKDILPIACCKVQPDTPC